MFKQDSGPLTLDNLFVFQNALRSGEPPKIAILDLSRVPYLDSAGHCRQHPESSNNSNF